VKNDKDLKYNASGCVDLTAYDAIKHIEKEDERFNKVLHILKSICDIAGFSIENRIILKDNRTGRVWR
jgi:hypothetical protein